MPCLPWCASCSTCYVSFVRRVNWCHLFGWFCDADICTTGTFLPHWDYLLRNVAVHSVFSYGADCTNGFRTCTYYSALIPTGMLTRLCPVATWRGSSAMFVHPANGRLAAGTATLNSFCFVPAILALFCSRGGVAVGFFIFIRFERCALSWRGAFGHGCDHARSLSFSWTVRHCSNAATTAFRAILFAAHSRTLPRGLQDVSLPYWRCGSRRTLVYPGDVVCALATTRTPSPLPPLLPHFWALLYASSAVLCFAFRRWFAYACRTSILRHRSSGRTVCNGGCRRSAFGRRSVRRIAVP